MKKTNFTQGQLDYIRKEYVDEKTAMHKIAENMNISYPVIRKALINMGVPIRRKWAKKTRVCRGQCGKELSLDKFSGEKGYICKKCRPDYNRQKGWDINYKFGINREQYEEILNHQNGGCMICGKTPDENRRELSVDHEHKTGKIRGLLCHNCNIGIGMFLDDINLLQKAIDYLS